MRYEEFCQAVKEQILRYLPESCRDCKVETRKVYKINEQLDCLNVMPREGRGKRAQMYPNIYLQDMYQIFQQSKEFETVMAFIARMISECEFPKVPQGEADVADCRKRIVHLVINREKNRQLLKLLPHREWLDLAVIYRIVAVDAQGAMYSVNLTYQVMETMCMNEDALFQQAHENTQRLFPTCLIRLKEELERLSGGSPQQETSDAQEAGSLQAGALQEDLPLYLLSNKQRLYGAGAALYEENISRLAEDLQTDLYLLPSSLHEMLILPDGYGEGKKMQKLVKEVNQQVVKEKDWLSDQVYHYSRSQKKLAVWV